MTPITLAAVQELRPGGSSSTGQSSSGIRLWRVEPIQLANELPERMVRADVEVLSSLARYRRDDPGSLHPPEAGMYHRVGQTRLRREHPCEEGARGHHGQSSGRDIEQVGIAQQGLRGRVSVQDQRIVERDLLIYVGATSS